MSNVKLKQTVAPTLPFALGAYNVCHNRNGGKDLIAFQNPSDSSRVIFLGDNSPTYSDVRYITEKHIITKHIPFGNLDLVEV